MKRMTKRELQNPMRAMLKGLDERHKTMVNAQLTHKQIVHAVELAGSRAAYAKKHGTPLLNNEEEATLIALRELLERREGNSPELKIAELINKFYERYPVTSFKTESERCMALGYFMAGAELQCFGEFIKYYEIVGDE